MNINDSRKVHSDEFLIRQSGKANFDLSLDIRLLLLNDNIAIYPRLENYNNF